MLFRKPEKPVDLDSGQLEGYLHDIFELDSRSIVERCARCVERLQNGVSMFERAVFALEAYEGEPDSDAIDTASATVVRDRKKRYALALRNAAVSLKRELESGGHETYYGRLLNEKSAYERFISGVLSLNSNFKIVVIGYPERMGNFKKAFSEVERGIKDMALELGRGSEGFGHYNTLKLHIMDLEALKEELGAISIRAADNDSVEERKKNREKILDEAKAIEAKRGSLSKKAAELSSHIRELSGNLESLLLPIERAARKYDYGKRNEARVGYYISNPYSRGWNDAEYSEFVKMMDNLKTSILDGGIEVKNKDGVAEHIDLIINSGIPGTVREVKTLERELALVRGEIKAYGEELYAFGEQQSKTDAELKEHTAELEKVEEKKLKIAEAKRAIERLFIEYYKKQIRIVD